MEPKITTLLPTCFLIIVMHSVCRCSLPIWRRSFLKRGPPWPIMARPGSTLGGSGRKTTILVRDHEYFIPTKFHQNPSNGSREEVENVKNLRTTDRRRDGALWPKLTRAFGSGELKMEIMFVYLLNTSHFIHFQSVRQKKWNIHNKTNKYWWHFRSKPHHTTSLTEVLIVLRWAISDPLGLLFNFLVRNYSQW